MEWQKRTDFWRLSTIWGVNVPTALIATGPKIPSGPIGPPLPSQEAAPQQRTKEASEAWEASHQVRTTPDEEEDDYRPRLQQDQGNDVKRIRLPRGVETVQQWGTAIVETGKHQGSIFEAVRVVDAAYARWIVAKLSSKERN